MDEEQTTPVAEDSSIDSILETIKKLLGLPTEVTAFNEDVRVSINTALGSLTQLGVGPEEGFRISGPEETWADFLGDDPRLDQAKDYVFIKTKLLFDPSQMSSMVKDSYNQLLREIEWRLNVQVDTPSVEEEPEEGGDNVETGEENEGGENQNEQ